MTECVQVIAIGFLLLDGQQRLATSTIILAALRDKMHTFSEDAAKQLQTQYISLQDHLNGRRTIKLQLNVFDRAYFQATIQDFPRTAQEATKKSHQLISSAYGYFREELDAGWDKAGGGADGFKWAVHIAETLRENMALVAVISTNATDAASIFTTLNDRGIGLSTVDLIRSQVLQRAPDTARTEILECWNAIFEACGQQSHAETLIRLSWVSTHGDVKARALFRVVLDSFTAPTDPLTYSQNLKVDAEIYRRIRDYDSDDPIIQESWRALRIFKASSSYPLLIAATHKLVFEDQQKLAQALVALFVRRNVVCNMDRSTLESRLFSIAKELSDRSDFTAVLAALRALSPTDNQFKECFIDLSFAKHENALARYVLEQLEIALDTTEEKETADSSRVHVEHIYPQTPPDERRWQEHNKYVNRLGNLTLLSKRLNEQIKNADFPVKKAQAFASSKITLTQQLLVNDHWSPDLVVARQNYLLSLASAVWPQTLIG